MCGMYSLNTTTKGFGRFGSTYFLNDDVSNKPIHKATPKSKLPVILDSEPKKIQLIKWGIRPSWMKKGDRDLINARAETINEKPTFRDSFQNRRCLIIADGFFEWSQEKSAKQPYKFTLNENEPFAFAGIWQEMNGVNSFVIITTEPNSLIKPIHNRMPVILSESEEQIWLDHSVSESEELSLLNMYPEINMKGLKITNG